MADILQTLFSNTFSPGKFANAPEIMQSCTKPSICTHNGKFPHWFDIWGNKNTSKLSEQVLSLIKSHCDLLTRYGWMNVVYPWVATTSLPEPMPWWRHQMETFSALLAICAGNSPVAGEFSAQRPVTRSFDVFFDLGLNERLNNGETQSCSWWRHSNANLYRMGP